MSLTNKRICKISGIRGKTIARIICEFNLQINGSALLTIIKYGFNDSMLPITSTRNKKKLSIKIHKPLELN